MNNRNPNDDIKDRGAPHKWIAYLFSGACETGKFRPKPPRTDSRRPGKKVTIHTLKGPSFVQLKAALSLLSSLTRSQWIAH
jgi:hypothetical protein